MRHAARIGSEVSAQERQVGEPVGVQLGGETLGEFGLATALMREREQVDHEAACLLLGQLLEEGVEGSAIGFAREEPVAVDEVEERHRLAAQGMDHVPVIDDLIVLAVRMRAPARQRHEMRAADEQVEPIVVEAHPQSMADQARWDRVEHLAQREAAGGRDANDHLLVVGAAPIRQFLERGALASMRLALRALRRLTISSMKRR